MRLDYFSEIGAKDVIDKYKELIGTDFYFEVNKKHKIKLVDILSAKSIINDGFHIIFVSKEMDYCCIKDFMGINNNIHYKFNDFERICVEL